MLSPAFGWSLAPAFDAQGARIVRTPIQVPEVNGIAGRFVRTARSECFHWLLMVSAEHLECALTVYISIIRESTGARENYKGPVFTDILEYCARVLAIQAARR